MSMEQVKEDKIKILEKRIKELELLNAEYELSATLINKNVELEEVVSMTLDRVMNLIKAERGCLMFWDEEHNELYIKSEKGPDSLPFGLRRIKSGEGIAGWAFQTGDIFVVDDVRKEPRFIRSPDDQVEIKSIISVPLLVEESKIGVINIGTINEYHHFTEDEIKTLRLIASRAALVIENVNLRQKEKDYIEKLKSSNEEIKRQSEKLEESNERLNNSLLKLEGANKELASLFEISVSLGSSLDTDTMLSNVFEKIREFCGASAVTIAILQEDSSLTIRASVGLPEMRAGKYRLIAKDIEPYYYKRIFEKQKSLFFRNVEDDTVSDFLRDKILIRPDTRSFYIFPLVYQDKTSGVMTVSCTKENMLSKKKLKFLEIISNHLAVSLENSRLFHETITKRDELNAIVDNMGDGVLTFDRNKKIISFNKAAERIIGIKNVDATGSPFESVLTLRSEEGKDGDEMKKISIDKLTSLPTLKWDGFLTTPDGKEKFISTITTSLKGITGKKEGGIVVIRDFSREKEVEQLKSDFVSYISHELRSPLTSIKGYTTMLIQHGRRFDDERKEEFLQIIKNEIDRLARLINNLLDLSKIESGKFDTNKVRISIPVIVERVINTYKITSSEHTLISEFPADFPQVYADSDQIEQALNNLVSNGIKYSPHGGKVTVGGEFNAEKVIIYVEDEGTGIAPEKADKVFEKFYRITGPSGTKIVGTGLGLFITKSIINAHGGHIWVEKGTDGKGSKFYFSLPYNVQE